MSEASVVIYRLAPETIDAVARRVVELQIDVRREPAAVQSEVLTLREAMAYVKRNSETAFKRWRRAWGVRPYKRGRYSRTQLDVALKLEARRRAA